MATRRPAAPATAPATPAATSPDPRKTRGKKGAADDFVDVSINELMPVAVRWLLDLVPSDQYETIFQDRVKHWNLVLPLFNFFLRRAFNAPDVVDELTTEFFAEVRREINIRAGNEPGESKTGKEKTSAPTAPKATRNLLKHLLGAPDNVPKYIELISGKDEGEVRKIRLLLDSLTLEELTAFFAMEDSLRNDFLATFVTKTKSFSELLSELKVQVKRQVKNIKRRAKKLEQSRPVQAVMTTLADKMHDRITDIRNRGDRP